MRNSTRWDAVNRRDGAVGILVQRVDRYSGVARTCDAITIGGAADTGVGPIQQARLIGVMALGRLFDCAGARLARCPRDAAALSARAPRNECRRCSANRSAVIVSVGKERSRRPRLPMIEKREPDPRRSALLGRTLARGGVRATE